MNAVKASACFLRGVSLGYRLAGRSLIRRFFVSFFITAILWGASIAVLWAAADVFCRLSSGETAAQTILKKFPAWNRVHGR